MPTEPPPHVDGDTQHLTDWISIEGESGLTRAPEGGLALPVDQAAEFMRLDPALMRDVVAEPNRPWPRAALAELADANEKVVIVPAFEHRKQLELLYGFIGSDLAEDPLLWDVIAASSESDHG